MKFSTDPLADLQHARECIALEAFSLSSLGSGLKDFLPSIVSAFASNKVAAELPDMQSISADQAAFVKLIAPFPYTELMELRAFRPEGVTATYLNYLGALLPVTAYLTDIQHRVVQPYLVFLASVVSNKASSYSSNTNGLEYKKFEAYREAAYTAFGKLYAANSYAATTTVQHVVDRNTDWPAVFELAKKCTDNMKSVDLSALQSQMKQASDYLVILNDQLQTEAASSTTRPQCEAAAERLSNGAYQVAKELEFFSSTYYRVLALNGAVNNTVEHIRKSIG